MRVNIYKTLDGQKSDEETSLQVHTLVLEKSRAG